MKEIQLVSIILFAYCFLIISSRPCSEHLYGSIRPDTNDCSKYYRCEHQLNSQDYFWKNEECPPYQYFNWTISNCLPNYDTCKDALPAPYTRCVNGIKQLDPVNLKQYLTCENSDWILKTCPAKHLFNETTKECNLEKRCEKNMIKNDPDNCAIYYVCNHNAEWVLVNCKAGMYFDNKINECVIDKGNMCDKTITKPVINVKTTQKRIVTKPTSRITFEEKCNEGTIKPDLQDCARYFICQNGNWLLKMCSQSEYFDIFFLDCRLDINNNCIKENSKKDDKTGNNNCKEDETKSDLFDCWRYYVCNNDKWISKECDLYSYYSNSKKQCITNDGTCNRDNKINLTTKKTYDNKNCKEGETKQDIFDCARYYVCKNDVWTAAECKVNMYYNNIKKYCILNDGTCGDPNSIVNINRDKNKKCKEGETKLDMFDCTRYYICSNDDWKADVCDKKMYYNTLKKKCIIDDGTCQKNELESDNMNDGPCNDGDYKSDQVSCNRYYYCRDGIWKLLQCPGRYYFNESNKYCLPNIGNCNPTISDSKIAECTEGKFKNNPIKETAYYECIKTKWVPRGCKIGETFNIVNGKCEKNHNEQREKPIIEDEKCNDGDYKTIVDNKTGYYMCLNNKWVSKSCPRGFIFDAYSKICLPDMNVRSAILRINK